MDTLVGVMDAIRKYLHPDFTLDRIAKLAGSAPEMELNDPTVDLSIDAAWQ